MNTIKPKIWVYISITGRPTLGTYGEWKYNELPEIDIHPKLKNILTVKDVYDNANMIETLLSSVTSCYIPKEENKNLFYCDQQGCVNWYFEENIGVYIDEDKSKVVAKSIPELFTRMFIENMIWYNYSLNSKISPIMKKQIVKYVEHYRKADGKIEEDCVIC